ncbi:MAG: hypothetical protein R3E87_03565 [Burkholderiaceae bacterium]
MLTAMVVAANLSSPLMVDARAADGDHIVVPAVKADAVNVPKRSAAGTVATNRGMRARPGAGVRPPLMRRDGPPSGMVEVGYKTWRW